MYLRRGWDFGIHYVLQGMFEQDEFQAAVEAAFPVDFDDPDHIASGVYFQSIDQLTKHRWSQRVTANGAGMYAVGLVRPLNA